MTYIISYKIAIASSEQINIDLNFGGAKKFLIYEVKDNGSYNLLEIRNVNNGEEKLEIELEVEIANECEKTCNSGCNNGHEGSGGCSDSQADSPKVLLILDCRCVICKKVGFQIQKQLEKKAITTFDVEGEITKTLDKITKYFYRVDNHQTLRGIANQQDKVSSHFTNHE